MSFSGSPKGTPHDWCRRTMKQNYPEAKKCSICWVSHMFSIWEYRYSYGICFGTVYALQISTPNISTPNILSFFFPSTPVGLKSGIFYVGDHDYIYTHMYSTETGLSDDRLGPKSASQHSHGAALAGCLVGLVKSLFFGGDYTGAL